MDARDERNPGAEEQTDSTKNQRRNSALQAPALQSTAKPLQGHEAAMLRACEAEIEKGLDSFFRVGQALAAIHDSRLYRESHATWEAYLEERWQMSDRRARQYITASQIANEIGTMVPPSTVSGSASLTPAIPSTNERQVRALASLRPDERRDAWEESVKTAPRGADGKPRVTGEHVKRIVEQRKWGPVSVPTSSSSSEERSPAPAKASVTEAPATVLDAVSLVIAALNEGSAGTAREAATAALPVLERRWRGTSEVNLARSAERLQKALMRERGQEALAKYLKILLRAIAGSDA